MLSNSKFTAVFIAVSFLATFVLAAPIDEEAYIKNRPRAGLNPKCQSPKAYSSDPLEGCPKNTVFVSQKHPQAKFRSINSALSAIPDDGKTFTILIDEGIYHEKVIVERISPLTFTGVTSDVRNPSSNRVAIWQSTYVDQHDPNDHRANCDAVVLGVGDGAAVGSSDFRAYNINFVQRQFKDGQEVTQTQLGPAAALCVENSKASFYGCGFSSYQDTIYVGPGSQAYFFKSIVKGMTDYLYGMGKAWFEQVQLLNRACGGGITAWRGDAKDATVGVYVSNSSIDKSPDASTLKNMEGKCHLGRPWNQYANSVYLNTWMSSIVAPEGFRTWNKEATNFDPSTTRFAEYKSSGPGGNMQDRDRQLEKILTEKEAKQITVQKVFGQTEWIDWETVKKW